MTPRAYVTALRHAIAQIGAESDDLHTLCGRDDALVVVPHSIAQAQLPVSTVAVIGDQRIGGCGDRRRATVSIAAFADGDHGQDVAEAITALWRSLLTPNALEQHQLDGVLVRPADDVEDAFDLREVPTQLGRAQLTLSIAATVLDAVAP